MITRKIGSNRGTVRLWLEGSLLSSNGFNHGDRYNIENNTTDTGLPCLIVSHDADGYRKIAGTAERPIIDCNGAKALQGFATGDTVSVTKLHTGSLLIVRV